MTTGRAARRRMMMAAAAWLAGCGGGQGPAAIGQAAPAPAPDQGPAGRIETLAIPSSALGRTMAASVYLPPAYDAALSYPLLYLFYGYGGDENAFFTMGFALHREADRLIAAGAIAPLIIAVPDYDNSFGVNSTRAQAADSAGGSIGPYEDYLIGELLPALEARFKPAAGQRHVGGVSMGGFAALHLALRHPTLFARVGAHSAALWNYSGADQFRGQRDWLYASPALRAERDPLLLAQQAEQADLSRLRFYLDVGTRDLLNVQVTAMQEVLRARGAASELQLAEGGHDAAFWRGRFEHWLRFYAGR